MSLLGGWFYATPFCLIFKFKIMNYDPFITGGFSLLSIPFQSAANRSAQRAQQRYTVSNMILANQMARDNYSLERSNNISDILASHSRNVMSRHNAGLSAVDGDNAQPAQPVNAALNNGSAPVGAPIQPTDIIGGVASAVNNALQTANISNVKAGTDKLKAERDKVLTDLRTANDRNLASLDILRKQGILTDQQTDQLKLSNAFNFETWQTRANILSQQELGEALKNQKTQIENDMLSVQKDISLITKDIKTEEYKQIKFVVDNQGELFNKQMQVYSSQIYANVESGKLSIAQANQAVQQAAYIKSMKQGQEIQNKLEQAKVPHAQDIASAYVKTLQGNADIAFNNARSAAANANISEYADSKKSFKFWFDTACKGILVGTQVSNAINKWINPLSGIGGSSPTDANQINSMDLGTSPTFGGVPFN